MNQINTIRNDAMLEFNQNIIPHCEEVYSSDNIRDCGEEYDAFITGSDQVWNPVWYNSAYYLDFVPSNKIKMSYAASLGKTSISDEQIEIFKNNLADYTAVGVRELDAVSFLQPYSPVPVAWNLDPTLLLDADEWDEICGERVINEKYVFCYFLGADKNQRNVAKKFAKKNKLKLVTIPFVAGVFEGCDVNFGDYKLYDASPEKFISLIKYAEYIFTDSFHATVFSSIYRKQYFVFQRAGEKGMGTRIYSLMKLFESEERFLDTYEKATLSYIESLSALTYNHELELFNEMKRNSFNYLRENLENKDITIEN